MRARPLLPLLLAAVVCLGATSAEGEEDGSWDEGTTLPGLPGGGGSTVSDLPGYLWWNVDRGEDDDGEPCWQLVAERRDDPPPDNRSEEFMRERLDTWDNSGIVFEACPVAVDPGAVALSLWVSLSPQGASNLAVPPGFALPGLATYVVFDGPGPLSAEAAAGGLTISIEAEPSYVVDFGDGSDPVRTTSTGVPYPGGEGEIRHVYTDAGTPTLTVSTEWTARYLVNGEVQAELPGRRVDASLEVPVEERRAVRTGP